MGGGEEGKSVMGTKNDPGEYDCYENAEPDEPMFVLLARDPHAPPIVRAWADYYESEGLEGFDEKPSEDRTRKAAEARACAESMEQWLKKRNTPKPFETSAGDLHETTRRLVNMLEQHAEHFGSSPFFEKALSVAREAEE